MSLFSQDGNSELERQVDMYNISCLKAINWLNYDFLSVLRTGLVSGLSDTDCDGDGPQLSASAAQTSNPARLLWFTAVENQSHAPSSEPHRTYLRKTLKEIILATLCHESHVWGFGRLSNSSHQHQRCCQLGTEKELKKRKITINLLILTTAVMWKVS